MVKQQLGKPTQPAQFGVPSSQALIRIKNSSRMHAVQSIQFSFQTRMRELDRQYELEASKLREEFLEDLAAAQNGSAEADED